MGQDEGIKKGGIMKLLVNRMIMIGIVGLLLTSCIRKYPVHIEMYGNNNWVEINVTASVPKQIEASLEAEVTPSIIP